VKQTHDTVPPHPELAHARRNQPNVFFHLIGKYAEAEKEPGLYVPLPYKQPGCQSGEADGTVILGPPVIRITSLNPKEVKWETKAYGTDNQYPVPLLKGLVPLGLYNPTYHQNL